MEGICVLSLPFPFLFSLSIGLFFNIKHEQLAYLDLYSPSLFSFLGFFCFLCSRYSSGCSFIPLYQSVLLPLYQPNPINQSYLRLYLLNFSCVSSPLPAVLYLSRLLFRPLSSISPFDSVRSTDPLPILHIRCSQNLLVLYSNDSLPSIFAYIFCGASDYLDNYRRKLTISIAVSRCRTGTSLVIA